MRNKGCAVAVVVAVASFGVLCGDLLAQEEVAKKTEPRDTKVVTVEMKGSAFVPETVEVNVGDTVTWVNRDAIAHTATRQDSPAFNTGLVDPGAEASITFTMASDMVGFEYFCIPHQSFMRGHVRVMLPGSQAMRTSVAHSVQSNSKDADEKNHKESPAKKVVIRDPRTVTVEMKESAFVPETVEINAGDTVRWINRENSLQHTATRQDNPAFNTGLLVPGADASITFNVPSNVKGFEYFCIPHQSFMRGHVRVLLPGSQPMRMSFQHPSGKGTK